ncbi:MAG: YARHG domain-containing protein [Saprospiraceae bacterium]|jgi:hypothetical protein|nr:YARHG domain-containing protein [Saprospiraceae bacterium]
MRNIILILVLFAQTIELKAQSDSLFYEFLNLFPGKQISVEYQERVLKIDGPFSEQRLQFEKRTAKKVIAKTDSYILLSIEYSCGAGGMCDRVELYSFSPNGKIISSEKISEHLADCGFSNSVETLIFEERQLITKLRKWKGDCLEEVTESEHIQINTYDIRDDGKIELIDEQVVDLRRKYFNVSTELLTEDAIHDLTKKELATIRNEIFASYGYQFTTDNWKDYFNQQVWYKPVSNSVTEKELTLVEKLNLRLIKNAEKEN